MKILIAIFCIVVIVGIVVAILYSLGTNSNKTCNKNEEYVGNVCQCINGYTKDSSGVCTKPASIDCKDPNETYNGTTKKCDCIDGYTRDLSGVCTKPSSTDCKDPRQIYNSITKKCECKDGYYRGSNNDCILYTFQLLNEGQLIGVTDDNQPVIIADNNTTIRIGDTVLKAPSNLQNAVGFQYNYGVFKGNKGLVTFFLGNNSWGICDLDLTKNTLTYDKDSSLNKMALQGVTMIAPIDINNDGDSLAICDPLTETAPSVFIKNASTQWKWTQKNVINDPKFFITNVAVSGPYQCIFGSLLDDIICMYKSSDSGNTWNSSPIPLKSITNSINQPQVSSSVILGNDIYIGINYGLVYKMDLTSSKNIPVVLEKIPRVTFWKQIVSYDNILFFLGNDTMYNSNTYIHVSKDNGNTFSEPIWAGSIPLESEKLFYNNNTLYVGNSFYEGKSQDGKEMYTQRVWKTQLFLI
jgi:hypothetical protein